ncbi:DUF5333 domain-containing protein [Roseobacter sinensis]|uniref:DUF5333 domain-containing protein n=1 Tax=Roseobacter sinensis TaxID=2931391 RepID=A0ABT3BFW2_9RHOB|nr:DUF5333 domain-containing protein [Roseobacter sp. WL0113]MCV3272467.1 DUF5333 domain-containing protein [Roseobacter sp. WL0113]
MRKFVVSLMLGALVAAPQVGLAKPPLREVKPIDDGLFAIGLADQIRKNCPEISARILPALSALQNLSQQAKDMGYTQAEIDAHVDSDVEKDRLRARAQQYMASKDLTMDQAGYCALGKEEIARNSTVGVLLRAEE